MSTWHDGYHFLSKLTPRRLYNASQVLGSYYASRFRGKAYHRGMPISLSVEPTTACNLRCPQCPSGLRSFTRPTGKLTDALFQKVMDELQETLCYVLFYFQGEPFLHPQLLDWVRYASQRGIYTATSTNAHFLSDDTARRTVESGLNRLVISIDGTTQQTYEAYRVGGKLEKVIGGTENIIRWKKALKSSTPHVIFQFLVVRPNEHQVTEVKALARRLGVDTVALKTAQIYNYQHGSDLIPTQTQYARYRQQADGTYAIKNPLLNHCWKMWHSCVITWDGQVVPCCFDKDAHHALGDVSQRSFAEIWQSAPYQAFRQTLLQSRQAIDICQNCTEGAKVWG